MATLRFETTSGVENSRVEAGASDTLWSLRTAPITPPRGFEKLRG